METEETYQSRIQRELEQAGYDHAIAIATNAEIDAGAACGQLAIIAENENPPL